MVPYLHHRLYARDPGYSRFQYISLFTAAMLMLVINNFMQLFFGWEAVVSLVFLSADWFYAETAIYITKAFLVNRGRRFPACWVLAWCCITLVA
jgi:NADH:ubiquinone oxidoreductase subunit 5 (subunit L)/multisubunit Na+/H+ antiporter MnhA subunit